MNHEMSYYENDDVANQKLENFLFPLTHNNSLSLSSTYTGMGGGIASSRFYRINRASSKARNIYSI